MGVGLDSTPTFLSKIIKGTLASNGQRPLYSCFLLSFTPYITHRLLSFFGRYLNYSFIDTYNSPVHQATANALLHLPAHPDPHTQ